VGGTQRALEAADHTDGDATLQPCRVADGHGKRAGRQRGGVADCQRGQTGGRVDEPYHREVVLGVSAEYLADVAGTVREGDVDLARAAHDVVVGQDDTIGPHDSPRAERLALAAGGDGD